MTSGPTSNSHRGEHLHNHPDAYWCADCHRFTLDCRHLVEPLENAPRVILGNWMIQSIAYDGARRMLELEMNPAKGSNMSAYRAVLPSSWFGRMIRQHTKGNLLKERIDSSG